MNIEVKEVDALDDVFSASSQALESLENYVGLMQKIPDAHNLDSQTTFLEYVKQTVDSLEVVIRSCRKLQEFYASSFKNLTDKKENSTSIELFPLSEGDREKEDL